MPTVMSSIDIHATPEMVWRVLTDFESYAQWNPLIVGASGIAKEKQRIKVRMRGRRGDSRYSAIILRAIPSAELRWRRRRWLEGIFDGERAFIIVPHGLKGVRVIQRERFTGLLAHLILPFIQEGTLKNIEQMNRALKRATEKRH